ncbi:MAG: Transcriptional regulatory protein WalR [Gammaproteobacteria bacterium]|nr:Transcriptional regulatory protein WalR [Gammaproteobacteria bacterium]
MKKPNPTVVVIDDSASVHTFFERCLSHYEADYHAFAATADAVTYLCDHRPDVVFLDIIMPDKDGLTFLQELRRMPLQAETPVIMITSKDYAQDRMVAKNLGAVDFVVKPMRTQTIRELIVKYTQAREKSASRTANG